jgi:hypothetical protein
VDTASPQYPDARSLLERTLRQWFQQARERQLRPDRLRACRGEVEELRVGWSGGQPVWLRLQRRLAMTVHIDTLLTEVTVEPTPPAAPQTERQTSVWADQLRAAVLQALRQRDELRTRARGFDD